MNKPKWAVPHPYGYAAAIDGMGSISAPLLAATSSALLAFVLTASAQIRWGGFALLLLTAATMSFVGAVQLTFWAKRFDVSPSQLTEWWPDADHVREAELQWEQRFHQRRYGVWSSRARLAYNSGVICLLAALPVMLLPPGSVGLTRAMAAVLAAVGLVVEVAWIATASLRPRFFDPITTEEPKS